MKKLMIVLTMALSLNAVTANAGPVEVYCKNSWGNISVHLGRCPSWTTFVGVK